MKLPTVRRYAVAYRDMQAKALEGSAWNMHVFETEEERKDMIEDIGNHESAWGSEAVTVIHFEVEVPITEALYAVQY